MRAPALTRGRGKSFFASFFSQKEDSCLPTTCLTFAKRPDGRTTKSRSLAAPNPQGNPTAAASVTKMKSLIKLRPGRRPSRSSSTWCTAGSNAAISRSEPSSRNRPRCPVLASWDSSRIPVTFCRFVSDRSYHYAKQNGS
jgi:hypothetical protein